MSIIKQFLAAILSVVLMIGTAVLPLSSSADGTTNCNCYGLVGNTT